MIERSAGSTSKQMPYHDAPTAYKSGSLAICLRDRRPSNWRLRLLGQIRPVELGAARVVDLSGVHTGNAAITQNPAYMMMPRYDTLTLQVRLDLARAHTIATVAS